MARLFSISEASAGLIENLAEKMAVDIPARVVEAPAAGGRAFRTAVLRCGGCAHKEACREMVAGQAPVACAPTFCRNASLLDSWRDSAA